MIIWDRDNSSMEGDNIFVEGPLHLLYHGVFLLPLPPELVEGDVVMDSKQKNKYTPIIKIILKFFYF